MRARSSSERANRPSFADRAARRLILGEIGVQLTVWRDLLGEVHHTQIATVVSTRRLAASRYRATVRLLDARSGHAFVRGAFLILLPLVPDPTPQQIQQAETVRNAIHPADAGGRALTGFPPSVPFGGVVETEASVVSANRSGADAFVSIPPVWGYDQALVLLRRRPDYPLIEGERMAGARARPPFQMTFTDRSRYVEEFIGSSGRLTRIRSVSFATLRRLLPKRPELLLRWKWSEDTSFSKLLQEAPDTVVILTSAKRASR